MVQVEANKENEDMGLNILALISEYRNSDTWSFRPSQS